MCDWLFGASVHPEVPLLWFIMEPQLLAGCERAIDPVPSAYKCVVRVRSQMLIRWWTSLFSASPPSLIHLNMSVCVCVVLNWPARRNALQLLAAVSSYRSLVFSDPSVSLSLSLSPSLWPSLCWLTSIQWWSRMYLWWLRSQMVCWHTILRSCVAERHH